MICPISENCFGNNLRSIKLARIAAVPFHIVSLFKEQIEYLRDAGMKVTLVSSSGPELSEFNFSSMLSFENINMSRSLSMRKDLIALFKLYRLFRKKKFDIVHSSTPKAGLLTAIAGFLARVPVRLHTFTGQPWVTLKGPMHYLAKASDKLIGVLDTACYADSKSQRQFLIDEKVISAKKISVIGEGSVAGVNLSRFDPKRWSLLEKNQLRKELSIETSSKIVIFLGRVARDKGVAELVSAFQKLLELNYDVDLLLVGPHDQECGERKASSELKIPLGPRIHHTGYTDRPERYLAISDIFCLPSYREGFGTAVIQAAAMGVPAVGTRINGLVDAVVDGTTGILVAAHDDKALFDALRKLLDNPALVKKMGEAAKERSMKNYDARIINADLAREYKRYVSGGFCK